MKKFKTNLGIEYDLEIIEVGLKSIVIRATCEEGVEEFRITFPFEIKEDNTFYSQLIEGDCSQITEDDLTDANAWVNEVTVSFISGKAAAMCVRKTDSKHYYGFSVVYSDSLSLNIYVHNKDTGMRVDKSYHLSGENEIKEFLYNNK